MGRAVASVVVGYLALALVVVVTFTLAYLILGPDGSYRPGSDEVSAGWIGMSIILSFAAAMLGGWLTAHIARHDPAKRARRPRVRARPREGPNDTTPPTHRLHAPSPQPYGKQAERANSRAGRSS